MERSKFVSPSAWLMFFNAAYSELYDLLIGSYQEYSLKPSVVTVSGGTGLGALPADFYKLKAIDNNQENKPVEPYDFDDRFSESKRVRYTLLQNEIQFLPKENANGSYTLWYVPTPIHSTDVNDTVSVMGWQEFIVLGMAVSALYKEESFEAADRHLNLKNMMQKRIEALAPNRNSNKRRVIRDVRSGNGCW